MKRALNHELEPEPFSRAEGSCHRDEVTSITRCGEDMDNPDMSLQSTMTVGLSLLHASAGDGSSSESTSRSPALRRLMRCHFDRTW
jgi:hypothetical protein